MKPETGRGPTPPGPPVGSGADEGKARAGTQERKKGESMKEKAKHTPGPWQRVGTHYVARMDGDGYKRGAVCKMANTDDAVIYCAGASSLEDAANAALIAAAPDLLAACKSALAALNDPDMDCYLDAESLEVALESAIEKATGQAVAS
jgi:hypothetical protein